MNFLLLTMYSNNDNNNNNNNNNKYQKFPEFQLTVFENKRTFMKNVVLHTTTLMHCKARQVLRDLFSTNPENLYQELLKLTSKISELSYIWRLT